MKSCEKWDYKSFEGEGKERNTRIFDLQCSKHSLSIIMYVTSFHGNLTHIS